MSARPEQSEPTAFTALDRARAVIAREILDFHRSPVTMGDIILHGHQRRAVVRLMSLVHAHRGALLADPTGVGKTFMALATARGCERVLIICPAALREAWRLALTRAARTATIVSFERLSRGTPTLSSEADFVIVDESHHLRNPRTRRYDTAASLCDRAQVLLLSATPVHNRRRDLTAQLALFLGDVAYAMSDMELARFVVRRDGTETQAALPAVVGPRWITIAAEDDVLDDIVALPPGLPLADEGEAHALLRYTLLRQWSSSRAALVSGLRGRLARGIALIAALDAGRLPTRHELAAWSRTDDAVQLAMPELLVPSNIETTDVRAARQSVDDHMDAVRTLLDRLRATPDPDPSRADTLRTLRLHHAGARIIAFSQYAQTVRALSRLLMARDPGVAELTARGGYVAGGRVSRGEVLGQFAPAGAPVPAAQRIDLLVTTDVSSEGLDLQLASVVVHLDLPWNPARLEQRVGRVRRLGSHVDRVFVYALAPPARSERLLDVETRLRAKLRVAAHLVGIGTASLPDAGEERQAAPPAILSDVYARLEHWRADLSSGTSTRYDAAVHAPVAGCVALLADGEERLLVGDDGNGPSLDPHALARLLRLAEGAPAELHLADVERWTSRITLWWEQRVVRDELRVLSPEGSRVRARIAERIASMVAAAGRHARPGRARSAAAARRTLSVPLGIAAERRLAELANVSNADDAWLARVAELGAGRSSPERRRAAAILALIVLVDDRG